MSDSFAQLKQQAAEYAVDHYVRSTMVVGLGVGSTASFAVQYLGHKLAAGELQNILGVPCSLQVEKKARELHIPLTTLEDHPLIDVTIDGADEVDPDLNVIKGGGGALLREKIAAQATRQEIIIVDETKLVPALGTHWALPIEVIPFGWGSQAAFLKSLNGHPVLRSNPDGTPFHTDQGNILLDCNFGVIHEPQSLSIALDNRTGIVAHGLFLGLVATVIVAGSGGIQTLTRSIP